MHLQLFLGLVYFSVEEVPEMSVFHVGPLEYFYHFIV